MADLTCIGLTTLDIAVSPLDNIPSDERTQLVEQIKLSPAGTAGGCAAIAATLGLDTALVSAIGTDLNGSVVRQLLNHAGVNTDCVLEFDALPTSTTVLAISSQGQRPNFHMPGASGLTAWSEASVALAKNSRFVHFAGVGFRHLRGEANAQIMHQIQQAGAFTTCDLISPHPKTVSELQRLLPYIDCFMPSEAEARVLLGNIEIEAAAQQFLDWGARHCIIKQGDQGVFGILDGEPMSLPAQSIVPVDTTSCGDSFCAGFITGCLRAMTLKQAAELGIATASLVAQGVGTQGKLTGFDQVMAQLSQTA